MRACFSLAALPEQAPSYAHAPLAAPEAEALDAVEPLVRSRREALKQSDTVRAAGMASAQLGANVVALIFTVVFARILGPTDYGSCWRAARGVPRRLGPGQRPAGGRRARGGARPPGRGRRAGRDALALGAARRRRRGDRLGAGAPAARADRRDRQRGRVLRGGRGRPDRVPVADHLPAARGAAGHRHVPARGAEPSVAGERPLLAGLVLAAGRAGRDRRLPGHAAHVRRRSSSRWPGSRGAASARRRTRRRASRCASCCAWPGRRSWA